MGQIASELGLEFGLGLGLESKSKEPVENKQEETFQPLREINYPRGSAPRVVDSGRDDRDR